MRAGGLLPRGDTENRYREPLRSVAIRIRKKQGELFDDGSGGEALRGADESVGLEAEDGCSSGIGRRRVRLKRRMR